MVLSSVKKDTLAKTHPYSYQLILSYIDDKAVH